MSNKAHFEVCLTRVQYETVLTALYNEKQNHLGKLGHTILINDALLAMKDAKITNSQED